MNDFIRRMIVSRKELFWDKDRLDPEKDKFLIVERILEFGTEKESQAVVSYYGDEIIRDVVRNSRNLSPKTVNYCPTRGLGEKPSPSGEDFSMHAASVIQVMMFK